MPKAGHTLKHARFILSMVLNQTTKTMRVLLKQLHNTSGRTNMKALNLLTGLGGLVISL